MSLLALLALCSLGAWQVCKWCADIVMWGFGTASCGDIFRQEFNRTTNRQMTLEDMLDEVAHKAAEDGVSITIDFSTRTHHEKYKPSAN